MSTKSKVLFRDKKNFTWVQEPEGWRCSVCFYSIWYPYPDSKPPWEVTRPCPDCEMAKVNKSRAWRSIVLPFSLTWEHIAERLEIRQVLHAFGWPRTPFAELLKRQARAIRANA